MTPLHLASSPAAGPPTYLLGLARGQLNPLIIIEEVPLKEDLRRAGGAVAEPCWGSCPSVPGAVLWKVRRYERVCGGGGGGTYVMGPYLDRLPDAVTRRVENAR